MRREEIEETCAAWRAGHSALGQDTHRTINARHYPGTRELCVSCGEPTGRAGKGEDSLYADDDEGPFCENCYAQP